MAAASLADIYDSIKHAKGQYCCVCFCLSSERKLVTPVFIIQLSRFYRKSNIEKSAVKVCYLCEATAGKVLRFQEAINLAPTVEVMLASMTDELRDALRYPGNVYVPLGMSKAFDRLKKVDSELRNSKMLQLTYSSILLVGSDMPTRTSIISDGTKSDGTNLTTTTPLDTSLVSPVPGHTEPIGTGFVGTNLNGTSLVGTSPDGTSLIGTNPDGTSLIGASPNGTSFDHTGPVVTKDVRKKSNRTSPNNKPILVADDPPPTQEAKLKKTGSVSVTDNPGNMQLQVMEPTGSIILHPIMIGNDGKMYVPSLKVEVVNNEILKSVSDEDLFQFANVPIPPKKPVARKKTAKKVTASKPENTTMIGNYYDFIKQQSMDKEQIQNGNTELDGAVESMLNKKARLEIDNITPDQDGRVDGISSQGGQVGEMSSQDGRVGGISSHDGRSGSIRDVKKPTYAVNDATKPVLRMDKVMDWEDKIPMDIISFMDATDPNPNERIMQPNLPSPPVMGVISDVRTIDDTDETGYITSDIHKPNGITTKRNNVNIVVNSVNNDEDIDNDVLLIENVECIDLC